MTFLAADPRVEEQCFINPPEATSEAKMSYATDEVRLAAVRIRDRGADGAFFFAVRTTGVYCRPSCAARPARQENIRFFASAADARAAGYRPCLRCRPDEDPQRGRHALAVADACRTIEAAEESPDLAALAAEAGMSRFHFHRIFKAKTGLTPRAYAQARRAARVRDELPKSATVTEAIYGAGFNSNGRFYAQADKALGMQPSEFRKGGSGKPLRFAVAECALGSILVAASEVGVCAILFGDDPESLVRDLQDRFPKADLIGGDEAFDRLVAEVVKFVESPRLGLDLPLDLQGTAFQLRVWRALCEIPPGSTRSYAEIATAIGEPNAARAVAQACSANKLAVAIPCHRVVRQDGQLSGYRWGIERKRGLLRMEARA